MTEQSKKASEVLTGLTSALLVLVDTLEELEIPVRRRYRDNMARLWDEMPEELAQGGEGYIFERLIDRLNELRPATLLSKSRIVNLLSLH